MAVAAATRAVEEGMWAARRLAMPAEHLAAFMSGEHPAAAVSASGECPAVVAAAPITSTTTTTTTTTAAAIMAASALDTASAISAASATGWGITPTTAAGTAD